MGRNILSNLQELYLVDAPGRSELDLRSTKDVLSYMRGKSYDAIIHMANPNPTKNKEHDKQSDMLQDSLQVFLNLSQCAEYCEKLVYLGSGAEFDKRLDMISITEESFGRSIPTDVYGFGKYVMQEIARSRPNIYNLRLFACYGPTDHESKFITHAIHCCQENRPVTIRQNCWFDYIHVYDLPKFLCFMVDNDLEYHDYNCCSGERHTLEQIAGMVCEQMGSKQEIQILQEGWNKEYTASNARFLKEYGKDLDLIFLEKGIEIQIDWQRGHDL